MTVKNTQTEKPLVKESFRKKAQKATKSQWLEVAPHGLVGGMVPDLCLMIFKELEGSKRFAIPLSHLQGQMAVQEGTDKEDPFRFMNDLLNALHVRVLKCYFLSCEKGHISTQVVLSGQTKSLTVNASDIIPFAVYSGCRFFCTEGFIRDMRDQKMEQPLKQMMIPKPLYLN